MPAMWGAAMEVPDITLQVTAQTASAAVETAVTLCGLWDVWG